MADGKEKSVVKTKKKSKLQALQSEFKKIIWTDRPTLVKQTIAVVVVTFILAAIISMLDSVILQAINFLLGLG
ncbi:MAG: preprotein translocase subunit SecE [Lachnospiraceae bacterium]